MLWFTYSNLLKICNDAKAIASRQISYFMSIISQEIPSFLFQLYAVSLFIGNSKGEKFLDRTVEGRNQKGKDRPEKLQLNTLFISIMGLSLLETPKHPS